ncbi:hypothetical protein [Endozoicomonas sp.]|uniref:hypothetical protein n=1 Tax=Endozoicomonas sp. TaxID=1892382 RepID=UPI002884AD75|nr:hypothetical protein [Endozoicomonas sp.]
MYLDRITKQLEIIQEQDETDAELNCKQKSPAEKKSTDNSPLNVSPTSQDQRKFGCRAVATVKKADGQIGNCMESLKTSPSGGTFITTETNTKRTSTTFIPGDAHSRHDGRIHDPAAIDRHNLGNIIAQTATLQANLQAMLTSAGNHQKLESPHESPETTERAQILNSAFELHAGMLHIGCELDTLLNQARQENQPQETINQLQQQKHTHSLAHLQSTLDTLKQLNSNHELHQHLANFIAELNEIAANSAQQPNESRIATCEDGIMPTNQLVTAGIEPESSQSLSKQALSFCNRSKAGISRVAIGTALTGYGIYSLTPDKSGQAPSSATADTGTSVSPLPTELPDNGNNAHTITTGIFLVGSGVGLLTTELLSWYFSKAQPACVAWGNRLCDICSPSGSVRLNPAPDDSATYTVNSNVVLP